MMGEIVTQNM